MDIDRVRQKLRTGTLPRERAPRTWVGPGSARVCMACDAVVARDDTEVECDDLAGRPLRFHQACFEAWEAERDDGGD